MFNQQIASNFANANRIGSNQNHSYEKSERRGDRNPYAFNQNQQLQRIISLLLPLIQILLSKFKNNDHCCQPNNLNLDDGELRNLNLALYSEEERARAGFPGFPNATGIIDSDCDGKISIGDKINTISINPAAQEIINGTVLVDQKIIDRLNSQQINIPPGQGKEVDLPLRQEDAIRQRFDDNSALAFDGLATQFTGRSFDDNGDGQLSAGDSIEIRRFGGNAIPQTDFVELQTLTAEDITAINTIASQPILNINDAQRFRLQDATIGRIFGFGNGPRLDSVIDNNGDNQISVGDTLKIVTIDGAETLNSTATSSFQTLTQEQFDRFEAGIVFDRFGQQVDGTGK